MKLNVGAGASRLEGFENVDVRAVGRDSRRGHAGDLSFAGDGTVEVVFSHAVFEHVYLAQRLAVLREWRRVLAPGGAIVCLGLPDFEAIARAYLSGGRGTTGERFDLFEAYRYTHGHPELESEPLWSRWNPARRPDSAPPGYVPQLHKGLFDAGHLSDLLRRAGLTASLLRYAYPGEETVVNLGFVAGDGCGDTALAAAQLAAVEGVEQFCRPETITWHELVPGSGRLAEEVVRLEHLRAPSRAPRLARRIARRARR